MKDVEIVSFIKTTLRSRGMGVKSDPIRTIIQFWDFEGNLCFEIDDWNNEMKLINFDKK